MENTIKRNRPIRIVLKEYVERRKSKIVEARKELQRRFAGLDWSIQKKILYAHLKSSKTDREWAYPRLLEYWVQIPFDMRSVIPAICGHSFFKYFYGCKVNVLNRYLGRQTVFFC